MTTYLVAVTGGFALGGEPAPTFGIPGEFTGEVLGGFVLGGEPIPVFITPTTYLPTIEGGFVLGGTPKPRFTKRFYLAQPRGGFVLGGTPKPSFTGGAATVFRAIVTGGFVLAGIPATKFIIPQIYKPEVDGGFKFGGPILIDVVFQKPAPPTAATIVLPHGGYEFGGNDVRPVFIHPKVYAVTVDPRITAAALVLGGGGGATFIRPLVYQPIVQGGFEFGADLPEEDDAVYQTYVLFGEAYEPSIFSNFRFNSYAMVRDQLLAAGQDAIFLLEGTDDDGADFHTGMRLGPLNFGADLDKRLRSIQGGSWGSRVQAKVTAAAVAAGTEHTEAFFAPGRFDNRIVVDRDLIGREFIIEIQDFDQLAHLEIIPLFLSRIPSRR